MGGGHPEWSLLSVCCPFGLKRSEEEEGVIIVWTFSQQWMTASNSLSYLRGLSPICECTAGKRNRFVIFNGHSTSYTFISATRQF